MRIPAAARARRKLSPPQQERKLRQGAPRPPSTFRTDETRADHLQRRNLMPPHPTLLPTHVIPLRVPRSLCRTFSPLGIAAQVRGGSEAAALEQLF